MNKYNISGATHNSVHKMPIVKRDDVKHVNPCNTTVTKTSPQSDTDHVKITKDSVTQAVFGNN